MRSSPFNTQTGGHRSADIAVFLFRGAADAPGTHAKPLGCTYEQHPQFWKNSFFFALRGGEPGRRARQARSAVVLSQPVGGAGGYPPTTNQEFSAWIWPQHSLTNAPKMLIFTSEIPLLGLS